MTTAIAWNVDADGDWSTAADWNPARLPNATDDVAIDTADLHTVTYSSGTTAVNSLTVGNDDFALTGGSLTVTNGASFANGLAMSGGSLELDAAATVAGLFSATDGTVTGAGTLTFAGGANIALLEMTGNGRTVLQGTTTASILYPYDGRVLENQGTLTLNGWIDLGNGTQSTATSGSLINDAGATLAFGRAGGLILDNRGPTSFTNAGTVTTTGSHPSYIDVSLTNNGSVSVPTGELDLRGGGTSSVGGLSIAAGSTLGFGTTSLSAPVFTITDAGTLGTAGSFLVNNGRVETTGNIELVSAVTNNGLLTADSAVTFDVATPNSGTLTTLASATFVGGVSNTGTLDFRGTTSVQSNLANASVIVNSGNLTVTGPFVGLTHSLLNNFGQVTIAGTATFANSFGFSQISGWGTTVFSGTTSLNAGHISVDGGQTIENKGVFTVGWGTDIRLGQNDLVPTVGGGSLINDAGATLIFDSTPKVQPSSGLVEINGGTGTLFDNEGLIRVIGTDETRFLAQFINNGVVKVTQGWLIFDSPTSTSSVTGISLANGATLVVDGPTLLTGGGTIGGGASAFELYGSLTISGAATTFAGTFKSVTGSLLDMGSGNAKVTGRYFDWGAGGTVSGTGTLTLAGGADFAGSLMTGTGRTLLIGNSTASGLYLDGSRVLENRGTLTLDRDADLGSTPLFRHLPTLGGGTIQNDAGATLVFDTSFSSESLLSGSGITGLLNLGAIQVSGPNVATVYTSLTNSGTISVQSGQLSVQAPVSGHGAVAVAAGATFMLNTSSTSVGSTITINSNSGTVELTGGSGADSFTFAPAALHGSDTVNGGSGSATDSLIFSGAGTIATGVFASVSHIEKMVLAAGTNHIALPDALVASADDSQLLTIMGSTGNDAVNGSAVTTAVNRLYIYAGSGNDTLTGGAGADFFYFATPNLNASDIVNGGTGASIDSLDITSGGTVTAAALAGISHIERIILASGGSSHAVYLTDALVGSADDNHVLTVLGSSGYDGINAAGVTTSANSVHFEGLGGADRFVFGAGADRAIYSGVSDSTGNADGTAYDSFGSFNAAVDRIDLPNADKPTSIVTVSSGTLNAGTGTFDTDMATAIGSQLAAHTAMDFHVTAGSLHGHEFLVINPTGTAGYVSGADYVIDVTGHTGAFATSTFI